jgi:hypothetical protein
MHTNNLGQQTTQGIVLSSYIYGPIVIVLAKYSACYVIGQYLSIIVAMFVCFTRAGESSCGFRLRSLGM